MQFGLNFHAGSKADALTRIKGAVSLPGPVAQIATSAINTLAGNPSLVKVSIAGEHVGDAISGISVSVSGNG